MERSTVNKKFGNEEFLSISILIETAPTTVGAVFSKACLTA